MPREFGMSAAYVAGLAASSSPAHRRSARRGLAHRERDRIVGAGPLPVAGRIGLVVGWREGSSGGSWIGASSGAASARTRDLPLAAEMVAERVAQQRLADAGLLEVAGVSRR